jgi:hypothetical protein
MYDEQYVDNHGADQYDPNLPAAWLVDAMHCA